jgi:hypothetical protein
MVTIRYDQFGRITNRYTQQPFPLRKKHKRQSASLTLIDFWQYFSPLSISLIESMRLIGKSTGGESAACDVMVDH